MQATVTLQGFVKARQDSTTVRAMLHAATQPPAKASAQPLVEALPDPAQASPVQSMPKRYPELQPHQPASAL